MIKKSFKIKGGRIKAFSVSLNSQNLILLKGSRGYIMCGYLNMEVADNFKDIAVRITGVGTIEEALHTEAEEVSREAENIGISKGQSVAEILKLIV
jgi:uncharacterized protein YunC (DUF1805 family)